jgi:hypothetical protein
MRGYHNYNLNGVNTYCLGFPHMNCVQNNPFTFKNINVIKGLNIYDYNIKYENINIDTSIITDSFNNIISNIEDTFESLSDISSLVNDFFLNKFPFMKCYAEPDFLLKNPGNIVKLQKDIDDCKLYIEYWNKQHKLRKKFLYLYYIKLNHKKHFHEKCPECPPNKPELTDINYSQYDNCPECEVDCNSYEKEKRLAEGKEQPDDDTKYHMFQIARQLFDFQINKPLAGFFVEANFVFYDMFLIYSLKNEPDETYEKIEEIQENTGLNLENFFSGIIETFKKYILNENNGKEDNVFTKNIEFFRTHLFDIYSSYQGEQLDDPQLFISEYAKERYFEKCSYGRNKSDGLKRYGIDINNSKCSHIETPECENLINSFDDLIDLFTEDFNFDDFINKPENIKEQLETALDKFIESPTSFSDPTKYREMSIKYADTIIKDPTGKWNNIGLDSYKNLYDSVSDMSFKNPGDVWKKMTKLDLNNCTTMVSALSENFKDYGNNALEYLKNYDSFPENFKENVIFDMVKTARPEDVKNIANLGLKTTSELISSAANIEKLGSLILEHGGDVAKATKAFVNASEEAAKKAAGYVKVGGEYVKGAIDEVGKFVPGVDEGTDAVGQGFETIQEWTPDW